MLKIKQYVKAQDLEQAYELNQKNGNIVLGGMLWLKMQDRNVNTAIDLSGLGLDVIEEKESEFIIGAMVSLRQLETHKGLNELTNGAIKESLRHIVGVQFRNMATVGGSVFGRYGFSDVLTILMALNAKVVLYKAGEICIEEFAVMKADKDILISVKIPKDIQNAAYESIRNTQTDFPVIACGAAVIDGCLRVTVGARPARAVCFTFNYADCDADSAADYIEKNIITEDNNRASAGYRRQMAKVLAKRLVNTLKGGRT